MRTQKQIVKELNACHIIFRGGKYIEVPYSLFAEMMELLQAPKRHYGKTKKVNCYHCQNEFEARITDINRGWGRYCSKSCKALSQKYRNHKIIEQDYNNNINGNDVYAENDDEDFSLSELQLMSDAGGKMTNTKEYNEVV